MESQATAGGKGEGYLLPITQSQAHVIVRVLLLLALLAGGAVALLWENPARSDFQTLLHDVRAGRVAKVEVLDSGTGPVHVRWSTGGAHLWIATIQPVEAAGGEQETGADSSTAKRSVDLEATIAREARLAGRTVRVEWPPRQSLWAANLPWRPLMWLTTGAWLITFLLMLGNDRARYANRWAWFWLFTFGGAGALIYLALEPRPLWRGTRSDGDRDRALRIRGGAGFLAAILLGIAVSLLGIGLHQLLGDDPRYFSGEVIAPVTVAS